jgi:hypothetical protein
VLRGRLRSLFRNEELAVRALEAAVALRVAVEEFPPERLLAMGTDDLGAVVCRGLAHAVQVS